MSSSREQRPASGPSASTRKPKANHHLRMQMVDVERRQWRLWISAIVVTVPLTLGILSFTLPYLLGPIDPFDVLNLDIAVRGLLAMVLLFDIYSIYQQVQIVRIRRRLQDSQQLFDLIGENAADLIAVVDMKGNRIYNSPSYERVLGYTADDLASSSGLDQVHPDDREKVIAANSDATESGIGSRLEYRMRHKNGSWRVLESTASVVRNERGEAERLVIVNRDITERKQAETELKESEHQLRQAQKMEAVGRLSGGIAHDFNNLLSVIIGYADELDPSTNGAEKLRRNAEQIKKAGLRAASLTRQLLAFSRQQVLQPKVLELNGVVADLAKMLNRLIGADVELSLSLDPAAGRIKADQTQIDQVIVNLVVNARDAMPEGGKLIIATANTEVSARQAVRMHNMPPGSYVQLTVTDTGTGMDAETLAHIFEPFFTTKEKGKGTGLGLSTVYGIIKQSGGYIWVDSELGRGTSFKIFLPRETDRTSPSAPQIETASPAASSSTILVVEDEESLRELLSELLERHGYGVLVATNGAAALEIARAHPGQVELLLTDVVLPGINGPLLARQLASEQPRMKVLYMSGYSDFNAFGHGTLPTDARLLQKPFTKEMMLQEVTETLARPTAEILT